MIFFVLTDELLMSLRNKYNRSMKMTRNTSVHDDENWPYLVNFNRVDNVNFVRLP